MLIQKKHITFKLQTRTRRTDVKVLVVASVAADVQLTHEFKNNAL
jgi:hypothetical protein